eukprot:TRINITY_DN12104_c0_g1_i4.p1 TRINITY_DN12104_c0_g1~~TRINITY_DN12104_c0_g1_i4.p1  ORF type:complete len:232 (+),score=29.88 TRINITY_DN12104_c0_g1_i4:60-698(+)
MCIRDRYMGLVISNRIARMLGSKYGIQVSSIYGSGAEFYFELPMDTNLKVGSLDDIMVDISPKSMKQNHKILKNCACRRILTVDDNDYSQMVIGRVLSRMNLDVVKAFSGQEALDYLRKPTDYGITNCGMDECTYFSMVLTDYNMPGMNGVELIDIVRRLPSTLADIPIILSSASDDKSHIDEGFKYGMTDFLLKPFTESDLKERLKEHIPS